MKLHQHVHTITPDRRRWVCMVPVAGGRICGHTITRPRNKRAERRRSR